MSELKKLLTCTDDDYLTGISNKGIVKRAYKDLEVVTPVVIWEDECATVTIGEESCRICVPLGESSCSCPSRSICRHVISAVLWLKSQCESENIKQESNGATEPLLKQELLDVPLKKLRIACGTKRYRMFCQKLKTGDKPELVENSTVTVTFPKEEIKVKLLEPLLHSTCSCHSKELCSHKAEAVLWYQIEKGQLKYEDAEKELAEDKTWDIDKIKEIAVSVKEVIREQLVIGLSRTSPTAEDTMERMAIICHEGKLPEFENYFRQVKGEYELYFTRNISFDIGSLRKKLLELYYKADKLEHADTMMEISSLAGEFRDSYETIGDLKLMGIGRRHFKSKSGYEGENYYFLELNTSEIYIWTDARPTFYEGKKRPSKSGVRMEAPWGLMCSREEMMQMTFQLSNVKATKDNRLSVSMETKGEVLEERNYKHPVFDNLIACDYEELLKVQFSKGMQEEKNQLVFIKAEEIGEVEFDTVNQVFHMELFDMSGNKIYITVHYTPEEKLLINALEKMKERVKKTGNKKIFFGKLYVENGQCHLYPVECFERGE